VKRGEVYTLADGRAVLIVSIDELEELYGACLAIVLHPAEAFPDTAMSVHLDAPLKASAVAVNLTQLVAGRFDGAQPHGEVSAPVMRQVDSALRAVLDL
jgi:mRNA interferase MazF